MSRRDIPTIFTIRHARQYNASYQRCDNLGCYGRPEFQTTHIDKLSEQGVTFDNAKLQAIYDKERKNPGLKNRGLNS